MRAASCIFARAPITFVNYFRRMAGEAAKSGHMSLVRLLLANHADPSIMNKHRHDAAHFGAHRIMTLLQAPSGGFGACRRTRCHR